MPVGRARPRSLTLSSSAFSSPSSSPTSFSAPCPSVTFLILLFFNSPICVSWAQCPPGSAPMPFEHFTGKDNARRKWRFYGYFNGEYAMDSEGVGTAGGVQFHFNDSPKYTEYVWQNNWRTWQWTVNWLYEGNPHHGSTYPAYEYDAHDVYLHDCETHPLSETCVQKGSDSCHGFALHMQAQQDNQGKGCGASPDYHFWVMRSTPMFLLEGQKFTWDVIYKDDFHCGLIYEDKPVNNWASHKKYEMTDVDGLYFEIAHDANPSGYRAKTKPLEVQFLVEKTGYARIACLVHEYETSSYLVFSGGAHTWSKDGVPCVGCEPGMFSVDGGACMACEGSTYQDLPNMPNCKFCPSGYTISGDPSSVPRQGETELLPALIRSSVAECAPCPPGRYGLDEAGCEKCPEGRFRAEPGALSVDDCAVCDLGQYADGKGESQCKKCTAGTYTVGTESTRQDMCLTCASGRYNGDRGLPQSECFACPEGFFQPHGSGGSGDFGIKWALGEDCHETENVLETGEENDLASCESMCKRKINCIGLSWDTQTKVCRTHSFLSCEEADTSVGTSTFYERFLPSACTACPPAKYQAAPLSNACSDCPLATFAGGVGNTLASDCSPCPMGKFGVEAYTQASECKLCPGGKFSSISPAQSCDGTCSKGKHRPQSNNPADHDSEQDCLLCGEKFFQDRPGSSDCLGCPAAKDPLSLTPERGGGYLSGNTVEVKDGISSFCTDVPCLNIACEGCKPGQFKASAADDADCLDCPDGQYTNAVAQLQCTDCEQGQFQNSLKQGCDSCPRGQFGKSVSVSLRVNETLACAPCAAGKYNPNFGALDASRCVPCDVGRYNENEGSPGAEDCAPCLPGKYSITPQSPSESNCIECNEGRFSSDVAAESATDCRPCPNGWYQDEKGTTSCLMCVPGRATNVPESEECTKCVEGKVTENAGLSLCMDCGEGKYADSEGQPVCFECAPGQYNTDVVSSDDLNVKCASCPKGQSVSITGATACNFCPMGYDATEEGQSSCAKCLLGRATQGVRLDVTNETVCGDCPEGYYADTYGSKQCKPCTQGTYAAVPGTVKCTLCLPGQFASDEESDSCNECPKGYHAGSESSGKCDPCTAGTWSGLGAISCTSCLPGRHAPNDTATTCTDCGTGFFSAVPRSTNCTGCAPGSWSLANAISCQNCSIGKAQPYPRQSHCVGCQSGFFSQRSGMANCSKCVAGTWSLANAISCQICAKGTVQPLALQDQCNACSPGTYQELVGASKCVDCPAGWAASSAESSQCGPCVEGRFGASNKTVTCMRCPIGWASGIAESSGCILCTAGRAQGVLGGTSCLDCQPGFFSVTDESPTCKACPGGFYQPLGVQKECHACEQGKFSELASRVCVDIPDSVDVAPPRIVQAEVVFARESVVDGVPLSRDTPANARAMRFTLEEPAPGVGSQGQFKGLTIMPIYTVVWWAQREDFTDSKEVGRFTASGWDNETEILVRASTTVERYRQLEVELPTSLYTQGFSLRLRAASYLNDTSWTRVATTATLPCPELLGDGTTNLPCPPFIADAGSSPEPSILHGEYVVPTSGPEREAYESSLFRRGVPTLGSIRVTIQLPTYRAIAYNDMLLESMNLRSPRPKCLFAQVEWSPDANFARLFVGGRPECTVPGTKISTTIDNFAANLDSLSNSIFSYPKSKALLFFRVRAYLDDSSMTSVTNPTLRFPGMMIREPQNIGDEDFAPQILNNSIVDDWTLTLRLMPPTLRNPESHILFLEVQASEKLQFRELVDVMYSGDPETPACSRARNKSTVSDLAIANALKNLDGEINMFGDIDNKAESAHVPGCLVSDRVRIRVNPQNSALPVVVNVTFPESIYEQGYFFRVSAVLSDSSVILQDQTYDNWGASSRSCQFAKEYLQTHRDNNVDWPFSSVEQLICRTCPLGASCSGEFVTFYDITARAGFRRLSWNHSVFGACPIAEACEGVKDVLDRNTGEVLGIGELSRGDKEFVEKCRSGHAQTSELCSDCIPKFLVRVTANPPGTCSKCPEGGTNMFMFVLLIFVALAYMGFLITDSLRGAKKMIIHDVPMPFHTIAIRIMSSYLQVAGMLMSFRVTLPRAVMDLVTIQRSASAVVEQTLSFDCTAGSRRGLELFFMKQTMAVAMPLTLPLVGCFWILANAWKRMRKQKLIDHINDKIGASIVVLYYLVFPAVVSRIAITFACTQYGDDGFEANKKFLMQRSLTTHCYSTSHTVHIATVTVPAIILYMLLVPGYLMYELHRLRKKGVLYSHDKHYEPGWTYRFGFLFAGYEPKYAHWEIVVLVRKAAFVLVTVFTRPAGMAAQVMSAVLVLILSLSAHIHFSPYDHDSHDALESASLHANLITLPVALLANEMSIVYGTGTIGEGGQQILGPAESALFTVTAFSTFGFFVYLFFHGILMEKVDDPGLLGKMSRFVCKCWHKKDEAGRVLRVKSTKSKSVRRKTITRMASAHGDAGRAHLVAMGLDPDEVNDEVNRLQKEKRLNKQFVSGVGGEGGIGADGVASRVKVRPLLPTQREKSSNSTITQNGGETALVAGTMGSAYLDLLPNGVKKPRGATMRAIESGGKLGYTAEVETEGKAGADIVVRKPPSAVQLDVPQTVISSSTTTSSTLNKPVTLAGPVTALASPAKPEKTPWLQPGYIETLTLKELKKAYKTAKAEANDLAYVEYKARYALAKAIDREESGRAKLVTTSLNADGNESAAAGTDGDERAAASAAGFARRLSRNRNKLKVVGGLVNKKRQSQSIVM